MALNSIKMIRLFFLFSFYSLNVAQNCNFTEYIFATDGYTIESPGYEDNENYKPGASCSWIVHGQDGFNFIMNCTDFNIPSSPSCSMNRLMVSKTGDPELIEHETYCGKRQFSIMSTGQHLSARFISSTNSTGGRFHCDLNINPLF